MHNVLHACISITRASGKGLGPGIREFFGPCEMASVPKKLDDLYGPVRRFLMRTDPLPVQVGGGWALVMDLHASKTLRTEPSKS